MPTRPRCLPPAVVLSLAAVLACGGCRSRTPEAMHAWAVSDMVNLTEDLPRPEDPVFEPSTGTVRLHAAANEVVSVQLVIDAGPEGLEDLRVRAEPLAGPGGTIPAERVDVFRMWPVEVTDYPAWYLRLSQDRPAATRYYDALIPVTAPRHGMPFTLGAGRRLALWVDVRVPRDAAPGEYAGALVVEGRRPAPDAGRLATLGGLRSRTVPAGATLPLRIRVHDFVLPDTRPMVVVGGFDHAMLFEYFLSRDGRPYVPTWLDRGDPLVREGLVVMRQMMVLAHEHRLDLFDRSLRPVVKRDLDGQVRVLWEDYDAIVKPYLDGTAFEDRIGVPIWPAPLDETFPDADRYGGIESETYRQTLGALVEQTARHFDQLNLPGRLFAWPVRGEPDAQGYRRFAQVAPLVRSAAGEMPILTQLPPSPPMEIGWTVPPGFLAAVDMLAPPAHLLDVTLQPALREGGDPVSGVYLAPGLPPYMPSLDVIAAPADVRAVPWLAYKYHLAGLFLPDVLGWEGDPYAVAPRNRVRLFYPGSFAGLNEVLPSVRLKRLRRGLQDVTYLWLLEQRSRPAVAQALADALARYAGLDATGDHYLDPRLHGWARDAQSWQAAHALLAEEVLDAIRPGEAPPEKLLASRLAWGRLNEQARSVRVERLQTRVEPTGDGALRIKVAADLYNELSRPVGVQLRLGELPEGLTVEQGQAEAAPLAPATRARLELRFRGAYLPTDATGRFPVPLELVTDLQQRQALQAEVPLLVTTPTARAIEIDGDLSDWPLRQGNTAGGFRLLGRRGEAALEGDAAGSLATRQTTAFVLHDADTLYLAIRAQVPAGEDLVARSNNLVRYDQLLASGEDLVEILLDPGARGGRADDLYHIAVKANGVMVAERGIQSDPPLGAVTPWPSGARLAMRREGSVWFLELAIPKAALGDRANEPFWGFNVIRYDTAREESSNWAGTPRYYYHPQNLGTLYLVPAETASAGR